MQLQDLDVGGRRVFVRVDFNVPLDGSRVTDDARIRAALPTIKNLRERGARVVLGTHFGRPKGQVRDEFRLTPVAKRLSELLGTDVATPSDCVGPEAEQAVEALQPGGVCLLENLRFHAGETKNDAAFVDQLARLCDLYVNDAFGTCHRAHASTYGLPMKLGQGAAGLLVGKEIEAFQKVLHDPGRPFVAVLGGAKISGKIESEGELVVGENGEIDAEVSVGTLSVSGKVAGNMKVREKVEIHSKGRISGELTVEKPNLVIHEGAVFEGDVNMNASRKDSNQKNQAPKNPNIATVEPIRRESV